jgi:hypothetical protein
VSTETKKQIGLNLSFFSPEQMQRTKQTSQNKQKKIYNQSMLNLERQNNQLERFTISTVKKQRSSFPNFHLWRITDNQEIS